jgi:hypothetical protein
MTTRQKVSGQLIVVQLSALSVPISGLPFCILSFPSYARSDSIHLLRAEPRPLLRYTVYGIRYTVSAIRALYMDRKQKAILGPTTSSKTGEERIKTDAVYANGSSQPVRGAKVQGAVGGDRLAAPSVFS